MEQFLTRLTDIGTQAGLKIIYAALILIVGLKLVKLLVTAIQKSSWFNKIDSNIRAFVRGFVTIGLDVLVIITAACVIGIPATSFVTLIASAGVAIGLAVQGGLANLVGGIMILAFKPFKVGDYIRAEQKEGHVTEISIFYTVLKTLENNLVTLPNGSLTNTTIENFTANGTRRTNITYSVSYDSDIDLVKKVLTETARNNPRVLQEQGIEVPMVKHNSSSLDFQLRCWCESEEYFTLVFELNEQVKRAFADDGILIPYQQMDVHIKQ